MTRHARLFLVFMFLLVLPLPGCRGEKTTLKLKNVTQPQTLVLTSAHSGPITGITVRMHGWTNGPALFELVGQDSESLNGTFDATQYHDWFEPACELKYTPLGVTDGAISIDYEFH